MSQSLSASGFAVSASLQPTVPSYPTTLDVATAILALMGAQSGVMTDYNIGSIIRTLSESLGAPIELQGIAEQTQAYQAMIYGAMAAFSIYPCGAVAATGTVTFTSPGPATQAVSISAGTLVQTNGGVQFSVMNGVALASGTTYVNAAVMAVSGGTAGNVPASGITMILTGLGYPLTVTNGAPTAGGANAETLSQTLSRFSAAVATPGLASPVAVANGPIGVAYGAESVKFANCYEPWIASSGVSGMGFTVYIDDGTGTASAGLISAVQTAMTGSATGSAGFRPAGVPYSVMAATPIYAAVTVSGSVLPQYTSASGTITNSVSGSLASYAQSLAFEQNLYQGNLSAVVGNAGEGQLGSFNVTLSMASGASGISSITGSYSGRIIISDLYVYIS